MKTIVCPVSSERIPAVLPRVTAFYVIAVLLVALTAEFYLLAAFLTIDFYLRGFHNGTYSLLAVAARRTSKLLNVSGKTVDKAPKVFAARLGFVFSLSIAVTGLVGLTPVALTLALGLTFFALLECVFDFCVGCVIYSWLVLPFAKAQ